MSEAFEEAARALIAVIADIEGIRPEQEVRLECSAPDRELLLVEWLNALVYEMATRTMLFGRFRVKVSGDKLEAAVWGERVDPERHQPAVEVKGATYTALKVEETPEGWVAQCVVDV